MIFDAIVILLINVFEGVLGLIPNYSPDFQEVGFTLGVGLAGANALFPVTALGGCMASLIVLRVFLTGLTLLAWVWDKIPFKFS